MLFSQKLGDLEASKPSILNLVLERDSSNKINNSYHSNHGLFGNTVNEIKTLKNLDIIYEKSEGQFMRKMHIFFQEKKIQIITRV